jgi:hypothetical protein
MMFEHCKSIRLEHRAREIRKQVILKHAAG